jgi:hypothetical protein
MHSDPPDLLCLHTSLSVSTSYIPVRDICVLEAPKYVENVIVMHH